jgi:hypothetical protein
MSLFACFGCSVLFVLFVACSNEKIVYWLVLVRFVYLIQYNVLHISLYTHIYLYFICISKPIIDIS